MIVLLHATSVSASSHVGHGYSFELGLGGCEKMPACMQFFLYRFPAVLMRTRNFAGSEGLCGRGNAFLHRLEVLGGVEVR